MSKNSIRKALVNDSEIIDQLVLALITFERPFSQNILSNVEIKGEYKDIINDDDSILLVCEVDNDVVGFVYAYLKKLDEVFIKPEVFIEAMYVKESYRKQNIGRDLLNEVINWASSRDVKYIDIDVMSSNDIALNAYMKMGFKEVKKGMRIEL